MKIVGFEANNGLRLGVVEGDAVIDLQAADAATPTDLGEALRRSNGDLKPLADLAKKAPASARRPLAGLKFGFPVAKPGKIICLGLNYLDHVKEGPQRDNIPKFPFDLLPRADVDGAASAADHPPARIDPARLRSRNGRDRGQARQASDDGKCG